MGWFWSKPKIRDVIDVKLFDASTNELIAQSPVPIDQLPVSFEAETTMHVGEQDWLVAEARPMTAEEFRKTGQLLLRVAKVGKLKMVDPKDILFSLATISDEMFGTAEGTSKLNKDILEITEDDTRQIEFISGDLAGALYQELRAITEIYDTARKGPGFSRLHVRKAVPRPLASTQLTLDDLRHALPGAKMLDGLSYSRVAGLVAGGFAIRLLSSITLYGQATPEGMLQSLCVARGTPNNAAWQDIEKLGQLAEAHDLMFVNWVRAFSISPLVGEFLAEFKDMISD